MEKRIELSIIIVNYNTRDLLKQCLASLIMNYESRIMNNEYEVIVVDNGSSDDSIDLLKKDFPEVKLITNSQNLGFAKANNLALREARGKFILLLNSDTVVEEDTLRVMVKFMDENPKVGVATCRVGLSDGSLDPACHRGFPTLWASLTYFFGLENLPPEQIFGHYHLTYKDLNTIHEIDSPSGAFYLIRKQVIDEVGLLDEDFFMYGEDLDWSYRIKEAGWKIMYVPDVKITHLKKQSGRENMDEETKRDATKNFYETMRIFYEKHYKNQYPFFINWLINWGVNFKVWLSLRGI